ncbi:transporter substrate-binding domain-containing protein [Bernardetia sp. Wsw4-3y2]|uniref:transporter substrate-binding domain-containing protein n=1 Tax=Bernardetia sp. Wsw4-3y2 TaxID=3127471 RepID=UPI0030CCFF9B
MRYAFLLFFIFYTISLFGQNDSTKKIIFGSDYDYPPYEFINKKGEYDGFHVDIMRAIGKEMGYEVEIQLGDWTNIREELEQPKGRINVADMFYSEERVAKIDYLPHHDVVSYIIVRNKKSPTVKSISQLKNQTIVVTANAIAEEYIKKEDSTIKMIQAVTELHALKIIASGRCNYAIINQYTAHKFIEEHNFDNLAVSEEFVFSKNLSFVVKKGNKKLAKDIEEGMNRIKENRIYSELYVKWFDNEKEAYTILLKRLKWIAAILLLVIVVVGSWVFTLRKQVRIKTKTLRNEVEERQKIQKLLFDKNAELEKRNYELDKFVYSVSHNVRSPIASALGLINVIQIEFEENTNLSFYVSNIGKSLHKLDYYVNKILAYVANKNFKVKKERIHFDGFISQLIEEAKFVEGAEGVEFKKEITQEIIFYSDTERLYIILECLIANSIEYKTQREKKSFVKISVRVTRTHASIIIEDNGQGIEEEQLDKVFEMFYRGNERSQGAGLGLYVVKQTVDQLEGTLQLQSNYKTGSIFTLQIPNSGKESKDNLILQ